VRLCRFAILFCPARNKSSRRDMWTRNSYTQFNPQLVISEYITDTRLPIRFDSFLTRATYVFIMNTGDRLSYVTVKFLGTKVPCTLGWPFTEGTWLYCDCFIWCVSCNVVVLTCFVMCGCLYVEIFVLYGCVYVWVLSCVGVLVICVLVFTVFCIVYTVFFIVYFMYIYSYLLLV